MKPIIKSRMATIGVSQKIWGLYVLPQMFVVLLILVGIVSVVPPLAVLMLFGMALYAFKGPKESMEALSLLAFFLIINKGLAPIGSYLSLFRWLILFAVFGRIMWDTVMNNAPMPGSMWALSLFAGTIFLFSILFSYMPTVSALKVVTFFMGVGSALTGFYRTRHLKDYWIAWFLTLSLFILIISIPFYALPWGYLRNGVGFQGVLTHPQVFGPMAAIFAAFLSGMAFFEKNRSRLLLIGVAIAWVGVYTSQSRTAFLAAAGGFILTVIIGFLWNQQWRRQIVGALASGGSFFVLSFLALFLALNWTEISAGALEFLLKDDSDTSVTEALQDSRSELIQRSLDNFRMSPVTGIGFGVPSDAIFSMDSEPEATGPLGIPLGASVEKGFMPSAVLEETGITGAVMVIILILTLIWPVIKNGRIYSFWIFMSCLLINAGEMVFFSVGGMGMFLWMLMAFCHITSLPQKKRPRVRRARSH